jgi:hypothetical protein
METRQEQIETLTAETQRLGNREGNATIQLCLPASNDPFRKKDCRVIDYGVSDNRYIVESNEVEALTAENKAQAERIEKLEDIFHKIRAWQQAYPLDIFPKPDLKKAHEVLKTAGMTLDAIAADNIRHVLDGIKDYVEQALGGESELKKGGE